MRILFVTNLYPPHILGGYEIECQQVAEALLERGHVVAILTSSATEPPIRHPDQYPGQHPGRYPVFTTLQLLRPFGEKIEGSCRLLKHQLTKYNAQKTTEALTSFQPDIIFHWSTLRIGLGAARACQQASIPIVWRFGDSNIESFIPAKRAPGVVSLLRSSLDRIFRASTTWGINFQHTSCISEHTKQDLIAKGLPLQQASVIRKGIKCAHFPLKKDSGVLHHPIRLLYVGQLLPEKGVETAIKAVKQLSKGMAITLTCVGNGPIEYCKYLTSLADHMIHFEGFVPHDKLSPIYQAHDIFLFPSTVQEGQGTTYLEAMSSGLPIISTSVGGVKEVLHDGVNALFFREGDERALAEQIQLLIEETVLEKNLLDEIPLRLKLIKNGLKTVSAIDFTHYIDSLEQQLFEAREE